MRHESIEITINRYVSVLKNFQNDELEKLSNFYNKNNIFKNLNKLDKLDIFLQNVNCRKIVEKYNSIMQKVTKNYKNAQKDKKSKVIARE